MSIQYQEIPANNLVPIFATEFDNSLASKSGPMPWKNLIIGQAKAGAPSALTKINTAEEAAAVYGSGSQIHLMVKAFRKNAKYMDLYVIGLQPESEAESAEATLTVSGPAAESAPLYLTIGGQAVTVSVANGLHYYEQLYRHDVPASIHIYPTGGHGWGYHESFDYHYNMIFELKAWLQSF